MPIARGASLTFWSLAALGLGLLLGLIGHASDGTALEQVAAALMPIGDLWLSALQMTVLPLVIVLLLAAIVGARASGAVGALGGRALILFVALLVAGAVVTIALAPAVIEWYRVNPDLPAALQSGTSIPAAAAEAAANPATSPSDWISGLLPRNLFQAALEGDILPLLLFTALFGIALTRLPDEQRGPITNAVQGVAAAMLTLVRWILWFTPVGVFVLMFGLVLGSGGTGAGMLAAFVVIQSGFLLLVTVLHYPIGAILGRVPIRVFARAVAPAQMVAVSTRSSIASLPALVQGGRDRLGLPAAATGLVLPLSVSIFKQNRTVSSTVKLLFLAHVFGIPLSAGAIAAFVLTVIILSFSGVGVPGGGSAFKTLPAYLAAGLPIEGIVILEAVDTIPDIFKTLLNVTADMSAATITTRGLRTADGTLPAAADPVLTFPAS